MSKSTQESATSCLGCFVKVFLFLLGLTVFAVLFIFMVAGLALYGMALGATGAILSYTSPRFRRWLTTHKGFTQRLAKLPGFKGASQKSLTIAFAMYLIPISMVSWFLMLDTFSDPSLVPYTAVIGLIGIGIIYGWSILGWGLKEEEDEETDTSPDTERQYFERMERLNQIKALDPIAFERFVGSLFEKMAYAVEETPISGDEGVDLKLRREDRAAVVQCKRYKGTVGQPVVRDLYGAMIHNQADEAYLVTTGTISLPAQQWAEGKRIHLVDGNTLVAWIETLKETSQAQEVKSEEKATKDVSLKEIFNDLKRSNAAIIGLLVAMIFPCLCLGSGVALAPEVTPTPTLILTPTATTEATNTPETVMINTATSTSSPTATESPTLTPEPTVTSTTVTATPATDCILDAQLIADVTIPDNTRLEIGQTFVKTWRIRNTGTCDWESGFRFAFVEGEAMNGPDSVKAPNTPAGESTEISVELQVPSEEGRYQSYWQVCKDGANCFGDRIYVQIVAFDPSKPTPASPPPPTPTPVDKPTATKSPDVQPTTASVCVCTHDAYNYSDFLTHNQAQACFNHCREQGRGDIHRLDRDNDGMVCESLP